MHQICIKYADIYIKYAQNMPLHRLQHMQKKYAKNMQTICRICISLLLHAYVYYVLAYFADRHVSFITIGKKAGFLRRG